MAEAAACASSNGAAAAGAGGPPSEAAAAGATTCSCPAEAAAAVPPPPASRTSDKGSSSSSLSSGNTSAAAAAVALKAISSQRGRGLVALKAFSPGQVIYVDREPLVALQHAFSERCSVACGNCFTFIGSLRQHLQRILQNQTRSREQPAAAAVSSQAAAGAASADLSEQLDRLLPDSFCQAAGLLLATPVPCGQPGCDTFYCSIVCKQIAAEQSPHRLLCCEASPYTREMWSLLRRHALQHHEGFVLAGLAFGQVICDVKYRGKTLQEAMQPFRSFHSLPWEDLASAAEEQEAGASSLPSSRTGLQQLLKEAFHLLCCCFISPDMLCEPRCSSLSAAAAAGSTNPTAGSTKQSPQQQQRGDAATAAAAGPAAAAGRAAAAGPAAAAAEAAGSADAAAAEAARRLALLQPPWQLLFNETFYSSLLGSFSLVNVDIEFENPLSYRLREALLSASPAVRCRLFHCMHIFGRALRIVAGSDYADGEEAESAAAAAEETDNLFAAPAVRKDTAAAKAAAADAGLLLPTATGACRALNTAAATAAPVPGEAAAAEAADSEIAAAAARAAEAGSGLAAAAERIHGRAATEGGGTAAEAPPLPVTAAAACEAADVPAAAAAPRETEAAAEAAEVRALASEEEGEGSATAEAAAAAEARAAAAVVAQAGATAAEGGRERQKQETLLRWLATKTQDLLLPFLGIGMYPRVSMTNHSCWPNGEVDYPLLSKAAEVRALRPIAEGEEVCQSYIDELLPLHARQQLLKRATFVSSAKFASALFFFEDRQGVAFSSPVSLHLHITIQFRLRVSTLPRRGCRGAFAATQGSLLFGCSRAATGGCRVLDDGSFAGMRGGDSTLREGKLHLLKKQQLL